MFRIYNLKIETENLDLENNKHLNLKKKYIWNYILNIKGPKTIEDFIDIINNFNNFLIFKNTNKPILRLEYFKNLKKFKTIYIKQNKIIKITDIYKKIIENIKKKFR